MTLPFRPIHSDKLTEFFDARVQELRKRKNGLHALQLKESYLSNAVDPAEVGYCHWIAHPVFNMRDVSLWWVQLFKPQPLAGKTRLTAVQTEHHLLTIAELELLQSESGKAELQLEHSGTLRANLITNRCKIESISKLLTPLSLIEASSRVGEWHILWPLQEIALCRDDGQVTVFLPAPVWWASFCHWVARICELDLSACVLFTRQATAQYVANLRFVHTAEFLKRNWMESLKSLLKANSIVLSKVSESLDAFDQYAERLLKDDLDKPSIERQGWDVFSSLNQNGKLLCSIPVSTNLENVQVVGTLVKTTEPWFYLLPELHSPETKTCVLSHGEALKMKEYDESKPSPSEGPLKADELQKVVADIELFSGQSSWSVGYGLYFDEAKLTRVLDYDFEAVAKFFRAE